MGAQSNAQRVSVIGSFNDWDGDTHPMHAEEHGSWYADVGEAHVGDQYRFLLTTAQGACTRIDPYAREVATSVGNAIVHDPRFDWEEDDTQPGQFAAVSARLGYLQRLGVNAIEIMPVAQFAYDGCPCDAALSKGAGAIFRVTLPVTAAPVTKPDVTAPAVPPPITGKELLVIDDEAATVKALVAVFRRDGHAVGTAANGAQALEKLQERSYDLIMCDLHMPALDGPGLYRALAQAHPHLLSRFILLTGDTLSPEAQAFLKASGAPHLAKPFRVVELRRLVRHTLQRLIEADSSRSRIPAQLSPPGIKCSFAAGGAQRGMPAMTQVEMSDTYTAAIATERLRHIV